MNFKYNSLLRFINRPKYITIIVFSKNSGTSDKQIYSSYFQVSLAKKPFVFKQTKCFSFYFSLSQTSFTIETFLKLTLLCSTVGKGYMAYLINID